MFRVPLQFLYAYCIPFLCDSGQTKKSLLESRDLVFVFGQTFSAEKGKFLKQLHLPRQTYFIIWFKCKNSPIFQIGNFHRIILWWMFHIPRQLSLRLYLLDLPLCETPGPNRMPSLPVHLSTWLSVTWVGTILGWKIPGLGGGVYKTEN